MMGLDAENIGAGRDVGCSLVSDLDRSIDVESARWEQMGMSICNVDF